MIRLILFAGIPAFLIALLWDDAPKWAILGGWAAGGALLAFGAYRGRLVLTCPYCFKRVKIGAQTCHHCGQVVTNTAAPGYQHDPMEVQRECPHCKTPTRPDATVCATCRRDVEPWRLVAGSWWDRDGGGRWLRLDQRTMSWVADQPPAELG